MGRIEERFALLKREKRKALVMYLTAGDPDLMTTAAILPVLEQAGADIVEIGVPFSDPTADGPAIQASSQRALKAGATLAKILELTAAFRRRSELPVVLFGYYNPILAFGPERFAAEAASSGADGLLVVDLPPEEAAELRSYTDARGLAFINLVAPTTDPRRVRTILRRSRGFVYLISVTGVTGTAEPHPEEVRQEVRQIKAATRLPVVIGFGIKTAAQAAAMAPLADGIVVGSALVSLIAEKGGKGDLLEAVGAFTRGLRQALDRAAP